MVSRAGRGKRARRPSAQWHAAGLREVRLAVLDVRHAAVRRRIAREVARLKPGSEHDALAWIAAVSVFDEHKIR